MAATKAKRIAITGPESTGKSELCKKLSEYYGELWVPEYSREYLSNIDGPYNYGDILAIAHGQYNMEQKALGLAKHYLFCDTDFMVTHIWCMVKYGKSHEWITRMASTNPYDFTLLCNIDIPWVYDPMRENENDREYLFNLYVSELKIRNIKFGVVQGQGELRLLNAIKILESAGFSKSD